MRSPSILFNARFATRPASGVDRVAGELLRALCDLLGIADDTAAPMSLALPAHPGWDPQAALSPDEIPSMRTRRGKLTGHLWEQAELPRWDPDSWLISPCNVGPLLRRRQLVVIHDAQPFLVPQAYSWAFRTWYRILLPALARRARVVVTVSQYSKNQLERFGIVPAGKAHVIHNGADHILRIAEDPATLQRYQLSQHGYILAIGSLAPHKNLAMLVDAAAQRKPGAPPLVIAGGEQQHVFARAGIEAGAGCRLLGRVTDGELKALYQNAIALAFPSTTEGFGLPPLEAMHCGCPVLASTAEAIIEACGDAAVYADAKDAAAWRHALDRVTAEEDLRTRYAKLGGARAATFTWRAAAGNYLAALATADAAATTPAASI